MKVIKNVILINILWLLKKYIFRYIQLFFQFGSLLSNFARKYDKKKYWPNMYASLDAQNLKFKTLTDSKYILNTSVKKVTWTKTIFISNIVRMNHISEP